jgi:hypothetical protein
MMNRTKFNRHSLLCKFKRNKKSSNKKIDIISKFDRFELLKDQVVKLLNTGRHRSD